MIYTFEFMRILHICQRDDPDIGGSLRVAEALAHEQLKCGIDAWILFLYGSPADIAENFIPRVACLELTSSRQALKGVFVLRQKIRRIAPDIIHLHDGILWPRLALLALPIPVVMHAHLPVEPSMKWISWMLIKKTTDVLIGISMYTIDTWVNAGYPENRIHYIQNGVDLDRFCMVDPSAKNNMRRQLGLPVDQKILLWVGRLHREMKGVDRVERIGHMLPDNTILVVVGNGPDYESMIERNADLLSSGKLVMTKSIPNPQDYYKAADGFLFTSHYEPFGLVILEAISSGLPILAFPVDKGGGAKELLSQFEACQIEDDSSRSEVHKAIHRTFSATSSAERLSDLLRSKYSWTIKTKQILDMYRTLLGGPRPTCASEPSVLVCQHGARHRYAIPRMLGDAGLLSAFYTDSSEESWIGHCVRFLGYFAPASWRNFSRWNIRGVPREKIYSSDFPHFVELIQHLRRCPKAGIELYHQRHRILSARMQKWGLREANMIYSMYHENLDFIRWSKDRGLLSVVDVFISPLTDQIMKTEAALFPDWVVGPDADRVEFEHKLWEETVVMADLLICPSDWVAEGVCALSPEAAGKTRVIPYGCSIDYNGRTNRPEKGRILFAGRDPLRKGLQYLAQAATRLKKDLPALDIRIAGEISNSIQEHPLCKNLNFIGQLDAVQMQEEFLLADVLVLPALSEGFASVVAEAIGAGCPVIVTREAGSPVVDGREGLVIPSKDIDALVSAIKQMVLDRPFRERCAMQCLEQIPFYTEDAWQERLVVALKDCANGSDAA